MAMINNAKNMQLNIFISMNYEKHYNLLILKAKARKIDINSYYENHHIIPKSEGGLDDKNNIVKLTAREHFLAHWLLYRIDPKNSSRVFAFWRMCRGRGTAPIKEWPIISSRIYEDAKLAHSKAISKALKGVKKTKEHAKKVGDAVRGQKRTEEQKAKLRKKHIMTEEGRKRLVDSKKGKLPANIRAVDMLDLYTLQVLQTFETMKIAANFIQRHNSNIHEAIKKNKMCGGYKWRYTEKSNIY